MIHCSQFILSSSTIVHCALLRSDFCPFWLILKLVHLYEEMTASPLITDFTQYEHSYISRPWGCSRTRDSVCSSPAAAECPRKQLLHLLRVPLRPLEQRVSCRHVVSGFSSPGRRSRGRLLLLLPLLLFCCCFLTHICKVVS